MSQKQTKKLFRLAFIIIIMADCMSGWMNEWMNWSHLEFESQIFLSFPSLLVVAFFIIILSELCRYRWLFSSRYSFHTSIFIFFMLVLLTGYCLFGLFFVLCVYFILGSTNFLPIPGTVCHFFVNRICTIVVVWINH